MSLFAKKKKGQNEMLSNNKILMAITEDDADTIEFALDSNDMHNITLDISVVNDPPPIFTNDCNCNFFFLNLR